MAKATRWQQEVVLWDTTAAAPGLEQLLATRGEQGWELVSTTSVDPATHHAAGQAFDLLLFFKRRRKGR